MNFLLGLTAGVILMSLLQRDVNKIAIDSKCPDIHIEAPKVNTVFEDSFKSCMSNYEKSMDKLIECQKDLALCRYVNYNHNE